MLTLSQKSCLTSQGWRPMNKPTNNMLSLSGLQGRQIEAKLLKGSGVTPQGEKNRHSNGRDNFFL